MKQGAVSSPVHGRRDGLFVVVLGEQLTRLGKQHRENQSGSHDHNRPKPIPPTRVLLLCIGGWWSDFRFISCGLLAHFWDPIAVDELIPARFAVAPASLLFLDPAIPPTSQPLVARVTQQPAEVAVSDSGLRSDACSPRAGR